MNFGDFSNFQIKEFFSDWKTSLEHPVEIAESLKVFGCLWLKQLRDMFCLCLRFKQLLNVLTVEEIGIRNVFLTVVRELPRSKNLLAAREEKY